MKRALIISSLVLNIVLGSLFVWSRIASRHLAFTTMADTTESEVLIQQHVLQELEADAPDLESLKRFLRRNIEQGTRAAADWRLAAD